MNPHAPWDKSEVEMTDSSQGFDCFLLDFYVFVYLPLVSLWSRFEENIAPVPLQYFRATYPLSYSNLVPLWGDLAKPANVPTDTIECKIPNPRFKYATLPNSSVKLP